MYFNNCKIKDALRQSHLFEKLTDIQLDQVFRHAQLINLDTGQMLFHQDQEVKHFYLMLSGKIKFYLSSSDGQEKIIEFMHAGDVFAETIMFMDEPFYPANTAALVSSDVLRIEAGAFKELLLESAETSLIFLSEMSAKLHKFIHEIDAITLQTGTRRLAQYFLQISVQLGENFELDAPKNMIAARLSIKPETFSRIIKNMSTQGILSVNAYCVTIHDKNKLQDFVSNKDWH
jgi:CRP/FNR family transcriptional regulator, dissimilatory nitrate respiration regulator